MQAVSKMTRWPRSASEVYSVSPIDWLVIAFTADAATLAGTVVRVVDADTVALEAPDERHRIRLAGIDAPERDQPWGESSTRELRRQVAGESVTVDWSKRDRWKRLIGVVRLLGEDMNLHMVDRGLAWHNKRYQDEQTPEIRSAYDSAEKAARTTRRGLWSGREPAPPWEWRRR